MTKFYQVGGSVRDEILGLKSKDKDYTVVASSYDEMKSAILERGGTIFLETPKFLTIRANVPNLGACDYVLARKEGSYYDGRHPSTVEPGDLLDDLSRRDFTMNAIAKDEDGNYVDVFGGITDAKNGIIRCVGTPEERFKEDGLRILRALRFSICKDMRLHATISSFMLNADLQHYLRGVSVERVREELLKMFKADTRQTISELYFFNLLFLFERTGLWLKPTMEQ